MIAPIDHPVSSAAKRQALAEVFLVFAVFFVQGAVPVPDVNEPYYLGKAIHYWNPDWGRGDFFLDESADVTHLVFYFTFGWLSLLLSPSVLGWLNWVLACFGGAVSWGLLASALAWFGRVLTWWLLAWAWRRLSFAVVPRRWCSILTAALFLGLLEWCHFAGEWVIGGVEAKGFAFVLVFLALEALVRNRWNRAWLMLGAAGAFHVLVGGWSAVAAALAWLLLGNRRPSLRSMWPAVLGGFLLSLPGLVPALILNRGTDPEIVHQAHEIYVFRRLAHHLAPWVLAEEFKLRIALFAAVVAAWLALLWMPPAEKRLRGLRAFVAGALVIAAAGAALGPLAHYDRALAAGLLRFYWFRLSDVAVPLGVALGAGSLIVWAWNSRPALGKCLLAVAIAAAGTHVGILAASRCGRRPPPADRLDDYVAWRAICNKVARSRAIPPHACFLTPRMSQTFKWYTGRSEVVNWKELPQDAETMVEWWRRLEEIHGTGARPPDEYWHKSLVELGPRRRSRLADIRDTGKPLPGGYEFAEAEGPAPPVEELIRWRLWDRTSTVPTAAQIKARRAAQAARWLKDVGEQYGADYVLTVAEPLLPLPVVCGNSSYVVYSLGPRFSPVRHRTIRSSPPDRPR